MRNLKKFKLLLPVLMAKGAYIFDGSKTTGHPGISVEILDNVFANFQVIWIFGRLVQKICALDELGTKEMLTPMNFKVGCECLKI